MNLEQKIDRVLTEHNFDRMSFDEAKKELLNLHSVSVSLPDDDEIEKKAEFRQRPRRDDNDPKDEFIFGFMQGADWMKSEILPNER